MSELIVFHVQDSRNNAPIEGVLVQGDGDTLGHWQGVTNPCGDFFAQLDPDHYTLTYSHPLYQTLTMPADLARSGIVAQALEAIAVAPAPRFWKGNMCGIRLPGAPAVAGGAADAALILSWFYDRYPSDWRRRIQDAWRARGYTHVLLSWPDARVAGATPESFAGICRELTVAGFYPCPMLCSKDHDPRDVNGVIANIEAVLPSLVGVVPLACIGWELSLWLSPTDVQTLIDRYAPPFVAAGARVYVHFQQGYGSFQQPGKTVADFWNPNVGKLTGLLHQKIVAQTREQYRTDSGGLVDMLQRFAGHFNVAADSGFGHPFDLVALEITATQQFNGQMNEADGDRLGQWAIDTPPQNGPAGLVGVSGSCNGFQR